MKNTYFWEWFLMWCHWWASSLFRNILNSILTHPLYPFHKILYQVWCLLLFHKGSTIRFLKSNLHSKLLLLAWKSSENMKSKGASLFIYYQCLCSQPMDLNFQPFVLNLTHACSEWNFLLLKYQRILTLLKVYLVQIWSFNFF